MYVSVYKKEGNVSVGDVILWIIKLPSDEMVLVGTMCNGLKFNCFSRQTMTFLLCFVHDDIYIYILIKLRSNAIIKLIIFLSVTVFSLRFVSSSVACLFQRCTIFNCAWMRSLPPHFPSPPALLHFIHTHMPTIKHRLLLLRNGRQILVNSYPHLMSTY